MDKIRIVQPKTQRRPARHRGPLSSEEYNNFQDQVQADIVDLANASNTNANQIINALLQVYSENQFLRRRVEALEEAEGYREFTMGKQTLKVDRFVDYHDSSVVIYPASLAADKAATFKPQFGEISLPINAVENKFYNFSLRTREVVVPSSFSFEVTGQFDKADGKGRSELRERWSCHCWRGQECLQWY